MPTNLTLQINSREALDRLIGDDAEVLVSIRRSIVDEFTASVLKPGAQDRIKAVIDALMKPAQEELSRQVNVYFTKPYGTHSWKIADSYQQAFKEQASAIIYRATETAIAAAVSEAKTVIDDAVAKAINAVEKHIKWEAAEQRLTFLINELAQKKVTEILAKLKS